MSIVHPLFSVPLRLNNKQQPQFRKKKDFILGNTIISNVRNTIFREHRQVI